MNKSSNVNAVSRYTRGRNPHKFQESHDFRGPPKSHALENRDFRERSGSRERNYQPVTVTIPRIFVTIHRISATSGSKVSEVAREVGEVEAEVKGDLGQGHDSTNGIFIPLNRQETLMMEWNNSNNCH